MDEDAQRGATDAAWRIAVTGPPDEVRLRAVYTAGCGGRLIVTVNGLRLAAPWHGRGRMRVAAGRPGAATVDFETRNLHAVDEALAAARRLLERLDAGQLIIGHRSPGARRHPARCEVPS